MRDKSARRRGTSSGLKAGTNDISDRRGRPPHVAKGMLVEATVE